MLPPNELKKKGFTKAVRGYSMVEVDEHIDFIIEKYTELYRENDELERKLRITLAKLEALKKDEESIRSALINAQRASSTIINEANERAEVVMRAAKTNCDKILSDFRADIRSERDRFMKLRSIVADFKKELFTLYNNHIEYIDTINPDTANVDDLNISEEVFVRRAISQIKTDIAGNMEELTEKAARPEPEINPEKSIPVSGQLQLPSVQQAENIKKSMPEQLESAGTKKEADLISELKNAPVSEDYAPENIAQSKNETVNTLKPSTDFNQAENECDFSEGQLTEESNYDEEYEEDFLQPDNDSESEEPYEDAAADHVGETKTPSFVREAITVPVHTKKKGSVKDTIRELNKLFVTDKNTDQANRDETGDLDEDDNFGAEEFDDYRPAETLKASEQPEVNPDIENSQDESEEDREYREFIKSIEEAGSKQNKKQKKNRSGSNSEKRSDFEFL